MGKDKVALWCKGAASTRSSNDYGGVNNEVGGSNPCRGQRMQLQGNKNSGEQRTGFFEQRTAMQHVVWKLQGGMELEREGSREWQSRKSEV